ncbi:inosine guanosine and xanthosine phosphorylase family protein [Trichuris suis]|nr:inosine guanosine and xanthosine phosphorylase family protein [Trichuris suis]
METNKPTNRSIAKDYDSMVAVSKFLRNQMTEAPLVGLVCGSGLGCLGEKIKPTVAVKYSDIPGFPVTSTEGHAGILLYGTLGGKRVVCMQGRFHSYEGYDPAECASPIRIMHLLGARTVILTAAAGALNPDYKIGDMMVITDHFCLPALAGISPLSGPNDERFGPRFPVMQGTYTRDLISIFKEAATEAKFSDRVREGVYAMIGGPAFATDTESKFLRSVGADAVGMSVVWESTVAHHSGMKVLAIAAITDVLGDYSGKSTLHQEVVEVGKKVATDLMPILEGVCKRL